MQNRGEIRSRRELEESNATEMNGNASKCNGKRAGDDHQKGSMKKEAILRQNKREQPGKLAIFIIVPI